MDAQLDALAAHLLGRLETLPTDHRLLISVSGIPGSGKSLLAARIVRRVNALSLASSGANKSSGARIEEEGAEGSGPAIVVGMDGWHYSRAKLDTFEDPKRAHDRRGAAFTFDAESFVQFISALRSPISVAMQPGSSLSSSSPKPSFPSTLYAPSFSHAVKDPIDRDIPVLPSHRLVVLEGLYCNLSDSPWDQGARLFDERWLVDVPREVARERLRVRHVVTGVAKDEEEALWRADNNDLPNGEYLLSHLLEPIRHIKSVEDPSRGGR